MRKILIVVLALVLVSCSLPVSTKIQVAGDSLVSLSDVFTKVSRHMTDKCVANVYTKKTCADFVVVSDKFKASYPAAKTLWNSATQFEDKGLGAAAQTAYDTLYSDLAPFIKMMGGS